MNELKSNDSIFRKTISFSLLKKVSLYYFTFAFVLTILQIFIEYYNIKSKIDDHVKDIQSNFKESLSNSLWEFNDIQTDSLLRGIVKSPVITNVEIVSVDNLVLHKFEDNKKVKSYKVLGGNGVFKYQLPLKKTLKNNKHEYIGTLVIYSNQGVIINELSALIQYIFINSVIKTLFLWVVLLIVFSKNLKEPLERFVKDIESINPQKPQKLSANDDDRVEEFYKVKKSMNNLIEELNNYKEVLEALLQNKTELLQERNVEVKGLLEDLKKAQALIIQQEKLSALGVLSAGISHELKNPLNISINTGLMLKDVIIESSVDVELKQELLKLIDTIVNNNKRLNNIIQSMLLQSRTSKDPLQEVKIKNLIDTNFNIIKANYNNQLGDIKYKNEILDSFEFKVYLSDFARLIINLLENSFQSLEEKIKTSNIQPEIVISLNESDDYISLSFYDNGIGIRSDSLSKVFDPFYTTKEIGKGTGLGLYLNEEIAKKHGGRIEIETKEGEFCKFIINLPKKHE